MKKSIVTFAFAALAVPFNILAQPVTANDDPFVRIAAAIHARSLENCDPAVDVPELSAKRGELLLMQDVRAKQESQIPLLVATGMGNAGETSVCFDTRLQNTAYTAVIYAANPRVIALNPAAPADMGETLAASFHKLRQSFLDQNAGILSDEEKRKPVGILPPNTAAPLPPIEAPRKQPEYRL